MPMVLELQRGSEALAGRGHLLSVSGSVGLARASDSPSLSSSWVWLVQTACSGNLCLHPVVANTTTLLSLTLESRPPQ